MKEEREKVALKLNIQKTKIMASGPITSWQTDGQTVEIDFVSGGSKITPKSQTLFWGAPKSKVTAALKLKDTCSLEEKLRPT